MFYEFKKIIILCHDNCILRFSLLEYLVIGSIAEIQRSYRLRF